MISTAQRALLATPSTSSLRTVAGLVQLTRPRHDRLSTHGARATHHQHRANNLRRARTFRRGARATPAGGLRGMELTHL